MSTTELNFSYAKMLAVMRLVAADPCTCGSLDVKVCRRCYTQALLGHLETEEPNEPPKRGLHVSLMSPKV